MFILRAGAWRITAHWPLLWRWGPCTQLTTQIQEMTGIAAHISDEATQLLSVGYALAGVQNQLFNTQVKALQVRSIGALQG
jgi:hypothetical protein